MGDNGNRDSIRNNEKGGRYQYDVYNWLSHMSTNQPLINNWLQPGDGNHVSELYKYQTINQPNTPGKLSIHRIPILKVFFQYAYLFLKREFSKRFPIIHK